MTVRRDLIAAVLDDYFGDDLGIEGLADAIDRGLPPDDGDPERDIYHYARGLADGLAYE